MLKLGFPVRDRPQRRRACASCVARPGQPSSPNHLALVAAHSCQPGVHISPRTLAHARPGVSSTGPSPARARPHLRPTPRRRPVHTTRLAQSTASCASAHHTPPLAGGAVGRRLRLHRLLPAVRGAAPAHHADAVRNLAGLVRASTHPTPVLACVHRPPAPHPCRCPLRPCYPLLPPPTPSCPSHSRRTPSRCTCAGLAWHRSMA